MTELPIWVSPLDLEILCNQINLSANSMDISAAQTVEEKLEYLHTAPGNEILRLLHTAIDSPRLPLLYLAELCSEDRITVTAARASLLAWVVTNETQVPRELQLRACLAKYHGHDPLINAGTGSGKTLPIALNLLLDNPSENGISLTISPLKRLQVTQVLSILLSINLVIRNW